MLLVDDVIKTDRTHDDGRNYRTRPLYRYQYSNHLGSACLELDHQAAIISYEEYHPYGTSAYRALTRDSEAPPKRYRYTGMERDEESGLSYHTARHYATWLGRWGSIDPIGIEGGPNTYAYADFSPINTIDKTGKQGQPQQIDFGDIPESERTITGYTQRPNEHHRICDACHDEAISPAAKRKQQALRQTDSQPNIPEEHKQKVLENIQAFEYDELPLWVAEEIKRETEWDERIDDPWHVERVQLLVNILLVHAELKLGEEASAQDKLDLAFQFLTAIRQQKDPKFPQVSDASRSVLLRDAQYYFWGRSGPGMAGDAGRELLAFGGENVMKPIHDYKKRIGRSIGKDLGTDARSSDNGGYGWFRLGLEHEGAFRFEEIYTFAPPRLLNAVPFLTKEEQDKSSPANVDSSYLSERALREMKIFFRKPLTLQSILFGPQIRK